MAGAGERGVLYAAMGTVATLGKHTQAELTDGVVILLQLLIACVHAVASIQEWATSGNVGRVEGLPLGVLCWAGLKERQAMAAAFAALPARVLWRLSKSEVPDENALTALSLGNNTKARSLCCCVSELCIAMPCCRARCRARCIPVSGKLLDGC